MQLQNTGPLVAVALILNFFGCQSQGLTKIGKTEKDQLQPVFYLCIKVHQEVHKIYTINSLGYKVTDYIMSEWQS